MGGVHSGEVVPRDIRFTSCYTKSSSTFIRVSLRISETNLSHYWFLVLQIPSINFTVRINWLKRLLSGRWVKVMSRATSLGEFRRAYKDLSRSLWTSFFHRPVMERTRRSLYTELLGSDGVSHILKMAFLLPVPTYGSGDINWAYSDHLELCLDPTALSGAMARP